MRGVPRIVAISASAIFSASRVRRAACVDTDSPPVSRAKADVTAPSRVSTGTSVSRLPSPWLVCSQARKLVSDIPGAGGTMTCEPRSGAPRGVPAGLASPSAMVPPVAPAATTNVATASRIEYRMATSGSARRLARARSARGGLARSPWIGDRLDRTRPTARQGPRCRPRGDGSSGLAGR
jgi:hypothetical protein